MKHSNRHFSNVSLTGKFHFRYMGLWVIISIGLLIVTNLLLLLLSEEHWRSLYTLDTSFQEVYLEQRNMMTLALGLATLLFSAAIVVLAKMTAHRIAGPYIKLQRVFESVQQGHFDQTLKFRNYDHLEDLEKAFNEMMVVIRSRTQGEPPA
jgi:nitrogen fixation/metabolism regulation signal transduction histidine kinase